MGFDTRILVTGGGGQLGRALARVVPAAVVLGRAALDITDAAAVMAAIEMHQPSLVINGAVFTQVDAAESDPLGARAINVEGTQHLVEACEKHGANFVYVSTDYVFAGDKAGAYNEDDQTEPASVYGKTKLEGERVAAQSSRHLIVRTSWVFGDGRNFVRSILAAAAKHDEVTVIEDQRGLPTYALDLAQGILDLVSAGAKRIVHLAGSGPPATWADVAEETIALAGLPAKVRRVTTAEYHSGKRSPVAPRPSNSVLDCGKAASLGVTLRPWREALAVYLKEEAI